MYIHIHACETKTEVEECIKKNGCTPIEHLESFGLLTDKTILAHCVHLSDNDIEIIKKHNTRIAHCPVSNFKLKSGLMAFQKINESGCIGMLFFSIAQGDLQQKQKQKRLFDDHLGWVFLFCLKLPFPLA